MSTIHSFAPIAKPTATVLILGSIPSVKSLQDQQYYAHPRNAFWKIITSLLSDREDNRNDNNGEQKSYDQCCQMLMQHDIAVWDVMKLCDRTGSLDANIDNDSIQVNDFTTFLKIHSQIERIYFNGAKAEQVFAKHCRAVRNTYPAIYYKRLPSTSPANAGMSFSEKLEAWRTIIEPLSV